MLASTAYLIRIRHNPKFHFVLLLYDISDQTKMLAARQAAKTLCCLQGQASTCARSLCLGTVSMDKVTHTGQKFEEKDPRNVRFAVTGLEKQVNTEWAIDLIAKVPPIEVNTRIVSNYLNNFSRTLSLAVIWIPLFLTSLLMLGRLITQWQLLGRWLWLRRRHLQWACMLSIA